MEKREAYFYILKANKSKNTPYVQYESWSRCFGPWAGTMKSANDISRNVWLFLTFFPVTVLWQLQWILNLKGLIVIIAGRATDCSQWLTQFGTGEVHSAALPISLSMSASLLSLLPHGGSALLFHSSTNMAHTLPTSRDRGGLYIQATCY